MTPKIFNIVRWPLLILFAAMVCEDSIPVKVDVTYTMPKILVKVGPLFSTSQQNVAGIIQTGLQTAFGSNVNTKWVTSFSEIEINCSK